jgi:hypothetical protein
LPADGTVPLGGSESRAQFVHAAAISGWVADQQSAIKSHRPSYEKFFIPFSQLASL